MSTYDVCHLSAPKFYALLTFNRNEPYDPHFPSSNLSTSWNRPGPSSQGPPHSPVLASRSPRFPRSPRVASRSPGVAAPSPRVTSVQAQINDTVEAMRANIAKVTARQEGLDSLEARTGTRDVYVFMLAS